MRGWNRLVRTQAGMSLVEATIILMVLATLTAVLAPSMQDYLDDARQTKAKEDCEAIGFSIQRLLMDTGAPFLLRDGDENIASRYNEDNRVDLLVSTGDKPAPHPTRNAAVDTGNITGTVSWTDDGNGADKGSMYDHLVSNEVGYIQPSVVFNTNDPQPPVGRGLFGHGWRGAYLSPVIGPDPWGNRYAVNSVYLGTANNSGNNNAGQHGHGWDFDTICLSAGRDARIDTNFEDTLSGNRNGGTSFDQVNINNGAADDIVYTLSGYGK